MAIKEQNDEAFVREVDEEYRRAELAKFWSRYGRWIVLGVGAFLVAFGGYLWWQHHRQQQTEALSERYIQAIGAPGEGGPAADPKAIAEIAAGDNEGYRSLARMAQAADAARAGDAPRAAGLYRAIADDAGLATPFRDLARIKLARLEFDAATPDATIQRMAPLLKPGTPWFAAAAELTALAHLKAGRPAAAGPLFAQVARDRTAPPSTRARAEQMAASLGQDMSAGLTAPLTSAPAPAAPTTQPKARPS